MNRTYLLLILTACVFLPHIALASLDITEIMYDPEGADADGEWIEIYNSGEEDITILGGAGNGSWRLLEESSEDSKNRKTFHFMDEGTTSVTIPPKTYAIIAKDGIEFKKDYPDLDVPLLLASLSLTNSKGKRLSILNGNGESVGKAVLYTPEPESGGTGASLQLQDSGEWIAGLPTPGTINTTTIFESNKSDTEQEVSNDFLNLESDWPFSEEKVYVDAGTNRRVFVDEEVELNGKIRFKNGGKVNKATITWAFGDGEGEKGEEAEHRYSHPGIYHVLLRVAYAGRLYQDSILIDVLDTDNIALGVAEQDNVEIENKSNVEVEVSGWELEAGDESKVLAEGTLILPRKTIVVPFDSASSEVRLYDSNGDLVDTIPLSQGIITRNEEYEKIIAHLRAMLDGEGE